MVRRDARDNRLSFQWSVSIVILDRVLVGKTTDLTLAWSHEERSNRRRMQPESHEVKELIGYLENPPLYADMTVWSYLRFCAQLRGVRSERVAVDRVIHV